MWSHFDVTNGHKCWIHHRKLKCDIFHLFSLFLSCKRHLVAVEKSLWLFFSKVPRWRYNDITLWFSCDLHLDTPFHPHSILWRVLKWDHLVTSAIMGTSSRVSINNVTSLSFYLVTHNKSTHMIISLWNYSKWRSHQNRKGIAL